MSDVHGDLRSYYEEEARRGSRTALRGRRVELRNEFIELLHTEGRRAVLDFGAGPGIDGEAFRDAGLRFVGIDLAHGNGMRAAERGVLVVQGSIDSPPIRPHACDAGWSMSTLMHIPEAEVPAVVDALSQTLDHDAPLMVGLWGGERGERIDETIEGERRLFSHRSFERNRSFFAAVGDIEREENWTVGDEQYHAFLVRVRHRTT